MLVSPSVSLLCFLRRDGYACAPGKVFFHGEEVDASVSVAASEHVENLGQGYAKTSGGHLFYKGQTIVDNSSKGVGVGKVEHLDGDWSSIKSGGRTKYLYRGELVGSREAAIDRGCPDDREGTQVSARASTQQRDVLLPEENRLGTYHHARSGNVFYK